MTLLPQSEESEKGLISAWIADPVGVPGLCAVNSVSETWFMQPFCCAIFRVINALWRAGSPCTYPTIVSELRKAQEWHSESPAIFHEIRTIAPIPSAAQSFIDILREKTILRMLLEACQNIESQAWGATDASSLVAEATKKISDVSRLGVSANPKTLKEHVQAYLDDLMDNEEKEDRIWTGVPKLDRFSPVFRGDMPVISGEKKAGKSILSLNIALHIAQKHPVLYFSLEDKTTKLIKRIVSNLSRVPTISHRKPTDEQASSMAGVLRRAESYDFTMIDTALDLNAIVGTTRQFKAQHPDLAAVFVDYLQLLRGLRTKSDSRENEVAHYSRTFRLLGMETNTAMFILSQLNSEGATRESKAIEMDTTAMWKISMVENETGVRMIEIPFQRDGDSGIGFRTAFLGEIARIEPLYEGLAE